MVSHLRSDRPALVLNQSLDHRQREAISDAADGEWLEGIAGQPSLAGPDGRHPFELHALIGAHLELLVRGLQLFTRLAVTVSSQAPIQTLDFGEKVAGRTLERPEMRCAAPGAKFLGGDDEVLKCSNDRGNMAFDSISLRLPFDRGDVTSEGAGRRLPCVLPVRLEQIHHGREESPRIHRQGVHLRTQLGQQAVAIVACRDAVTVLRLAAHTRPGEMRAAIAARAAVRHRLQAFAQMTEIVANVAPPAQEPALFGRQVPVISAQVVHIRLSHREQLLA